VDDQNNHQKSFGKSMKGKRKNKHKKSQSKDQSSRKGRKPFKYKKSLKEAGKVKGSFKAHFNVASDEATTSGRIPDEDGKPKLLIEDYINEENTIERCVWRPRLGSIYLHRF
jgi:hypothetical protein